MQNQSYSNYFYNKAMHFMPQSLSGATSTPNTPQHAAVLDQTVKQVVRFSKFSTI